MPTVVAVLLILSVAAGIAYPFVWGKRGFLTRGNAAAAETADLDTTVSEETGEAVRPTRARDELCPHCSRLNPPGRKLCVECSGVMPVDSISNLWEGSNKEDLIREGIQAGILFALMLLAMVLAYNLPLMGKLAIMLITVAALSWRLLRAISD